MGFGIMFSHAYRSGLNTGRKEGGGLNELLLAWRDFFIVGLPRSNVLFYGGFFNHEIFF